MERLAMMRKAHRPFSHHCQPSETPGNRVGFLVYLQRATGYNIGNGQIRGSIDHNGVVSSSIVFDAAGIGHQINISIVGEMPPLRIATDKLQPRELSLVHYEWGASLTLPMRQNGRQRSSDYRKV